MSFVRNVLFVSAATTAIAGHVLAQEPCVPTSADPATYVAVDIDGNPYYVEEREPCVDAGGPPTCLPAPVPGSGFVLGKATMVYQEANDLDGLQRGGHGILDAWMPTGCDEYWRPSDLVQDRSLPGGTGPCLVTVTIEPIEDETCGHGPDAHVIGAVRGLQPRG